jgi:ornithine cyclodeaminase/alanine dehydrogenase
VAGLSWADGHVHTANVLVQDDGLTVGMTVSATGYPIPASAGTVFNSVGLGLQDLAAAELVVARARELGAGKEVNVRT